MCWCVTSSCGSLIRSLITLFVVVVIIAGFFFIKIYSGGGRVCPLVPFYGLLLFSCVLSSSVNAESELLCLVLILSTVTRVTV